MKTVSHYGVHWDNDVAYLMQGRGGTNARGLKEVAPFKVQLPLGSQHCNHMVPIAAPIPNDYQWDQFLKLLDDQLVRALLPLPQEGSGVFFFEDRTGEYDIILATLSRMSSPIYNIVVPFEKMTDAAILASLATTNIQPLVLTRVAAKHYESIKQLVKVAAGSPRRLILVGDIRSSSGQVTTTLSMSQPDLLDLLVLPWENLGARVILKHMRNEPLEGDQNGKRQHRYAKR